MKSIETGKAIYNILKDSVQTKVFPLVVEDGTEYPFIVYRRNGVNSICTKDFHLEDEIAVDILCISNDYKESVEVAKTVLSALEDKQFATYNIISIKLNNAYEDYVDNTFVQTLEFTITIKHQ
jgi:hypothetical protein